MKIKHLILITLLSSCTHSNSKKSDVDPKQVMSQATEKLRATGIEQKAKKKGDKYVDFVLLNQRHEKIQLKQVLKNRPVILTFYRGGWCPYCNEQLQDYQARLGDIKKRNARLIAVSPDRPTSSQDKTSAREIEFDVLSDPDNQVAEKYNLVFEVGLDVQDVYRGFGIDLEKAQGNNRWRLPVPATYVISKKGEIIYSFVDVDYKKRAKVDDILKALDQN